MRPNFPRVQMKVGLSEVEIVVNITSKVIIISVGSNELLYDLVVRIALLGSVNKNL